MAVSIRLTRTGARNARAFRVVAADSRSPRDGRFIENLGWYDPARTGETFHLDVARVEYWRDCGAVLSDTVVNLLKQARQAGDTRPESTAPTPVDEAAASADEEGAAAEAPVTAETGPEPSA